MLGACQWPAILQLVRRRGCRPRLLLEPLLFSIVINGLVAIFRRRCPVVQLRWPSGPWFNTLLYADDLVILADSKAALQIALDIVHAWGQRWRFCFVSALTKREGCVFTLHVI